MSEYLIKKDNHSVSGLHFGVHFGITEQKYKVRFSKECLYQPLDWENDYNKLCGWSYGMHHDNSIRVCWRPYFPLGEDSTTYTSSALEVCVYVYENGDRNISEKTLILQVETDYDFQLKYDTSINTILANFSSIGNGISMNYHAKPSCGYKLYPYFGGNAPAPKDISIKLEKL